MSVQALMVPPPPVSFPRRRSLALLKAALLLVVAAVALFGLYRLLDSTALDVLRYRFSFGPVILVLMVLNAAAVIGGLLLYAAYHSIKRDWTGFSTDDEAEIDE